MSTFRHGLRYSQLLRSFDVAVEKVWPEYLHGPCARVSSEPKDLEGLVVASYSLMKYIRAYLKKKKLPFEEGIRFPSLYTALQDAVIVTTAKRCTLAVEANSLERVSRSAYQWMKTYRMMGKGKVSTIAKCMICKSAPATDDSGMLCDYCSEASEGPFNYMGFPLAHETDQHRQSWRGDSDMMMPQSRLRIVRGEGE